MIISKDVNSWTVEKDGYIEVIEIEPIQQILTLKETYIGTRGFTVEVDTQGVQYSKITYYIDNEPKEESNNYIYTIDNLEPETTHKIKVIAESKNGIKKQSNELNITTKPITYLYQNGMESDVAEPFHTFKQANATITFERGINEIKITSSANNSSYYLRGIQKKVDLKDYRKLLVYITSSASVQTLLFGVGIVNLNSVVGYDWIKGGGIENNVERLYEVDVKDIQESVDIFFMISGQGIGNVNFNALWLEK